MKRTLYFNLNEFSRGFSHHTDMKVNLSIKTVHVWSVFYVTHNLLRFQRQLSHRIMHRSFELDA